MATETNALLGREQELAAIDRFLTEAERGAASLTFEGEAGIGKTVLVEHALDVARRRDFRVLTITPTRAESSLSFVGLTDLLADAHELFDELPPPQRRALEVALLLDEPAAAESPEPRAIGMGILGVLRRLAGSNPVVVVVDDLQWLDTPSAAALSFAFRRVANEPIGLLAAARGHAAEAASGLRGDTLVLEPLSAGALQALLTTRLELSVPRSLLLRIHEASRGNPLFALEIGRALRERGVPKPGEPFEIPADVEALFAARLAELPADTLDALAVAAASAAPSRSLVGAVSSGTLDPALRQDMIRFDGERIHFTHPLLASAVYGRLDPEKRRELHARIAIVVKDREERSRHLALASATADADVAAALDDAADQAAVRGAHAAAAELAELAVRLTPGEDVDLLRGRRRVAAQQHFRAGDVTRSREILEPLVVELPPGPERAQALLTLASANRGDLTAAVELLEQAAAEAVGDDRVLAVVLRQLGHFLAITGEPQRGLTCAREAVSAAERAGDVRLLTEKLAYVAWRETLEGGVTPGLLERAVALEPEAGYLLGYENPTIVAGVRLMVLHDDLEAARARLVQAAAAARDHADEMAIVVVSLHLADLECRAGRFDDAARYATEANDLAEQFDYAVGASLYYLASVEALRGRAEAASAAAERGCAVCEEGGYELYAVANRRVLGLLALSTGDAATAAHILAPLPDRLAAKGYKASNLFEVLPDAIEATIGGGQLDRAGEQLARLDAASRALGTAYAQARAARCRGLFAGAERDFGAALSAFDDALEAHDRLPDPVERGRTLLALGQTQRRAGHRRDARETLDQALAIFEEIGAALWAEQARAELARLGGRTPTDRELTAAEERVAALVASGKTNREVAAALFVTERTVETHLSSVYRKLDLRSRTELAGRLAARSS
jgi:DNA-binding CsgD family transcriptional regulator